MAHALLDRRSYRPDQGQPFLGRLSLARGRVHEVCGPARLTLAALMAAGMEGPVFWLRLGWERGQVHGPGLAQIMDPGRVTFVEVERAQDLLWTMEEVLRAGVVPLVMAEVAGPVGLTPVRRMQLAAEAGGGRALGLLLSPEGGSAGVESRWHMNPEHGAREGWRLTRQRARDGGVAHWPVTRKGAGFELEGSGAHSRCV